MTVEYRDLAVTAAQIHLVDLGHALLAPVLRAGPRLRGQGARAQGRAPAPGRRGHRGRPRPRHARRRDRRSGPAAWSGAAASWRRRWPARRVCPRVAAGASTCSTDLTVEGAAGRLRGRRRGEHPGPGRQPAPAARLGGAAERRVGRRQPPRRRRRQAAPVVPLQGQGHHGDDRPRRRDRRGRAAPPRAARRDRLLRLAGRPRRADDRRAHPRRRVHRVGLGLLLRPPRTAGARPLGRRPDRLGRMRRRRGPSADRAVGPDDGRERAGAWRPRRDVEPRRRCCPGLAARAGAEPDGVHAGLPHHPGVARRGVPGDHADRQLPRPAPRRRRTRCCSPGAGRRWWR